MITIDKKLIIDAKYHQPFIDKVSVSDSIKSSVEKFNQNISDGLIDYEEVSCLCGNNTFDLLCSVDVHSIHQKTVMCKHCGLIQANPRYSEDCFRDFLESYFYKCLYFGGNLDYYSHSKFNIYTGQAIFQEITKVIKITENTKVLEIGCAAGWNLLPFANLNAKITGVDFNNKFIEIGRNIGLNIKHITPFEIDEKFDVIILNKVFNLYLEPIRLIKKINEILTDKGVLYINILNFEKFDFNRIKNTRINYFTHESLNFFVTNNGFKEISFRELEESYCSVIYVKGVEKTSSIKFCKRNLKASKKSVKKFILKNKIQNLFKKKK